MSDLLEAVIGILLTEPGTPAKTLAKRLGVDKSTVNSILSRYPSVFMREGDNPPHWFLLHPEDDGDEQVDLHIPAQLQQQLYPWQMEALVAWAHAGRSGVVEAVTGTGKTRVGVAAIADSLARGGKAEVIVPGRELQEQWCEALAQILGARVGRRGDGNHDDFIRHDVLVSVVNTAARESVWLPPGGLLVADECHRYGAPMFSRVLRPEFSARLGLTATLERRDEGVEEYLRPYFGETCFTIGYERALAEGIIARFRIALVGVDFAPHERAEYERLSEDLHDARQELLAFVDTTTFAALLADVTWIAGDGEHPKRGAARWWLKTWTDRRKPLAEASGKESALRVLHDSIADADRALIFVGTIEHGKWAARLLQLAEIAAAAMHAELERGQRVQLLDQFRRGLTKVLVAPRVLDEGIDVPAADLAIILSAFQSRRQMIQRMGRVLRLKDDGRAARFVICFVRDTSEDPDRGAHEDFLDEILDVADDIRRFEPTDRRLLRSYLSPR